MLTEMGGIVESQVALAAEAIMNRDSAAATRAVEEDPKVDALEREVEQFVIRMLALRQPMAGDLRRVVAALKITGDLERIGDYAANVAKRSIVLAQFNLPYSLAGLAHMAHLVQEQLKSIIDALGASDSAQGDRGLAVRPRGRRHLQRAVPRTDHLHDGRSAQHHAVHASAVHRQEPGADRRPRHQHRRNRLLRRRGRGAFRMRGRRATPPPMPSFAPE